MVVRDGREEPFLPFVRSLVLRYSYTNHLIQYSGSKNNGSARGYLGARSMDQLGILESVRQAQGAQLRTDDFRPRVPILSSEVLQVDPAVCG